MKDIFGEKGSHSVYFPWTGSSQFKRADTNSLWHMVIRGGKKSHLKKQDIMDENWRILLFCFVLFHVAFLWHMQGNTSWSCFWLRLSSPLPSQLVVWLFKEVWHFLCWFWFLVAKETDRLFVYLLLKGESCSGGHNQCTHLATWPFTERLAIMFRKE